MSSCIWTSGAWDSGAAAALVSLVWVSYTSGLPYYPPPLYYAPLGSPIVEAI